MRTILHHLSLFRRFARDDRGNFATIFALTAIPILGLAGAAVDYTNASRMRAQLQEALDGAAIAGARSAGRPAAEITQIASSFARANLPTHLQSMALTVEISNDNTTVRVRPTNPVEMPTALLPIIGINSINVSAASEATNGFQDLEIVLVLDNTGSMAGQKISVLRTAVRDFVNFFEQISLTAGRPDAVRIGIVPFNRYVRMGTSFRSQPWMNFTTNQVDAQTWEGCVEDRNSPNDVLDTDPSSGSAARFVAVRHRQSNKENAPCELQPVIDLTQNWTALRTAAQNMREGGETNVPIGMAHGFHMLTSSQPYTAAAAPRPRLAKFMVMLTDGDNTQNRWDESRSQIDARTAQVCTNIKSAGINLYTIRVINGNANLLRNCASSPSMYYNVATASEIGPVLSAIAAQISSLRLSR